MELTISNLSLFSKYVVILNPQYFNPDVHVPVCSIKYIRVTQLCDVYFCTVIHMTGTITQSIFKNRAVNCP